MQAKDQRILNAICNGATYKAVNVYRERITEDGKELYRGEQVIVEDKLVGEDCTVVLTDRANGVVFEWWQGAIPHSTRVKSSSACSATASSKRVSNSSPLRWAL